MHLFYTPDIEHNIYQLNETESGHCIRVLRLQKGDNINLIDGRGGFYQAKIIQDKAKACIVEVQKKTEDFGKRDYSLHLAVAPTKSIDRFEFFLEKATEIGVDEITPLLCKHSERKMIRNQRLEKIITSSVKQSLTAYHPKLNELLKFNDFINGSFSGLKLIAHCYPTQRVHIKNKIKPKENYTILIGPEGDFSEEEITAAIKAGFTPISLGNSRLRTETAGIIACHAVAMLND
ncbi:MAG: 16S rRNA (uracil(1498)-N(3))-methyltransferase [Bacteroidota bacterium]|nr:16S rRNA (uracil(1498)-N(3))-methyltransferase [Bacteroidota bacterium]